MRKFLFPGQQTGESIYLVVRQHWVILAKRLIIWGILVAALMIFRHYLPLLGPSILKGPVGPLINILVQIYILFLVTSLFIIWVLYYLNMYIVTNERIVDVDQKGLFSHHVSELNMEKIEDVTSETNGILGHIFDYGTVYIQTAGTRERFEFLHVPNPGRITKLVLELYERTTNNPHLIKSRD
jgi:uncharacterized membrane protein YdbT with pleckstrin-like domain